MHLTEMLKIVKAHNGFKDLINKVAKCFERNNYKYLLKTIIKGER